MKTQSFSRESMKKTIFALSTAPGKAGVAIIRVSGPDAAVALAHFGVEPQPLPRQARFASLTAPDGTILDQALVLFFPAPHSFTGEMTVEFHVHGSRAVIRRVLEELGDLPGFRLAEPGEFSRRAFLSGKMDLTAAEGLADLIDAETEGQRRQALRLMGGEASWFYGALRERVLSALALLEAFIDFPEEEIPDELMKEIEDNAATAREEIDRRLAGRPVAERIREGISIAILGPPNTGKSSLLNYLAQRDAAIVSSVAGTTRDVIEIHLDIGGYPVILADTAGIRDEADSVEQEGIRRSLQRAETADIRLVLCDPQAQAVWQPQQESADGQETVFIYGKADLATPPQPLPGALCISTVTGQGMDALQERLAAILGTNYAPESPLITNERHRRHLREASAHLHRLGAIQALPIELKCEELRRAAHEIGKITGQMTVDELLGRIFSRFCIGK